MVPNDWSNKLFKQVLKLERGSSPRPIINFITESSDGVNWIKIGDTKGNDTFINYTKEKITPEGAKKSRKVNKGEIILSNSMSYGKPYILNIDGYIHDGWFVIKEYEPHLDKQFLIQVLGSELVQRQYKRLAAGGVVTNISSELVYAVKISFPSLPEQRKIAKILSTWDKAISTTENLIENSKLQKKALMQQLLTGKKRLINPDTGKPFEEEWEEFQLSNIVDRPICYGVLKPGEDTENGIPLLRIQDIKTTSLNINKMTRITKELHLEFKRTALREGDLVISIVGTLGKVLKVPKQLEGGNISRAFAVIGVRGHDTEFIKQYLSSDYIQEWLTNTASGNAQKVLNIAAIKKLRLSLPSLKEQQKVASVLINAEKEVEFFEKQLESLKNEKKALMQQLLTGKIRVKVQ
ncbi:restriction endonuclease subunit S [Pleionea litopenaei]|uniref:Restriction endonuclease subunit S n=1 Tax=Pleionea litopenaei TaxID=3070815 RepID=A0AA51RSA6_9GAMM|nr:restriction endonuclease subunit S [Pleionea sp. HL-JVS1]WMS86706.1 restriction endonuclease subunit S [Pleionea sp. HL-JVS1]